MSIYNLDLYKGNPMDIGRVDHSCGSHGNEEGHTHQQGGDHCQWDWNDSYYDINAVGGKKGGGKGFTANAGHVEKKDIRQEIA